MKIRTFDDIKGFILSEFSGGTLEIATGAFGANQQFGIDQQDGALEISQNGKLLWSSAGGPHLRPKSISSERPFTPQVNEILRRADEAAIARGLHFVDSTVLLLGMIDGEGWEDSYAADIIAEASNVKIMRDRASSIAGTTGWKEAIITEASEESPVPSGSQEPAAPKSEPKEEKWNVHDWQKTCICKNCGMEWNQSIEHGDCSGQDAGERTLVQLAGCLEAAEGNAARDNDIERGDYGWSPAYEAVKAVRGERVNLWIALAKCERVAKGNRATIQGTGATAIEAVTTLRAERDRMRVSLEAERAANADKVQTIARQCRERRAIKAAIERSDMAELQKILNPPESDEPESAKKTETEIKTVVLDVGPDHLKIVEIKNVTALRAERDRLKKSYAKARAEIIKCTPCTCPADSSGHDLPHAPTCRQFIAREEFPKSP